MFWKLLRLRFIEIFTAKINTNTKGKKKVSSRIISLLVMLYVFVFFSFSFANTFNQIIAFAEPALYLSVVFCLAFFITFMGSVFTVQYRVFEPKDNDLLLSLPIKPRDIILSRLMSIFVYSLLWEAAAYVPAIVVWARFEKLNFSHYIFAVTAFFLLGIFTLTVSFIIAAFLQRVTRNFKNKSAVITVLSVIMMLGYFVVYYGFNSIIRVFADNVDKVANVFSTYLKPIYYFGKTVAENNFLYLSISIFIIVGLFLIILYFVSKNISKLNVKTNGKANKKFEHKKEDYNQSSVVRTLIKKERKRFLSSSVYFLNAGLGVILTPIIFLVLAIYPNFVLLFSTSFGMMPLTPATFCVLIMMLMSTVFISACSITVEGKSFWIVSSLPINPRLLLISKALNHIILASASSLISSLFAIVLTIRLGVSDAFGSILLIISPISLNILIAFAGVLVDAINPRLNARDEVKAIKQNVTVGIFMFIALIIVILLTLPALMLPQYSSLILLIETIGFLLISGIILLLLKRVANRLILKN
ncbi:MAG TPA: hypothetical protein GXZ23_05335 [Clostridiales bacterium]|nr:hypothetical protein [Clostridiales bacterium]